MPIPESVRLVIDQAFGEGRYMLRAYWQPHDGRTERMVILRSDPSQRELSSDLARVQELLLHVYEQGRADAALGF